MPGTPPPPRRRRAAREPLSLRIAAESTAVCAIDRVQIRSVTAESGPPASPVEHPTVLLPALDRPAIMGNRWLQATGLTRFGRIAACLPWTIWGDARDARRRPPDRRRESGRPRPPRRAPA